jgi:hypothetical protein
LLVRIPSFSSQKRVFKKQKSLQIQTKNTLPSFSFFPTFPSPQLAHTHTHTHTHSHTSTPTSPTPYFFFLCKTPYVFPPFFPPRRPAFLEYSGNVTRREVLSNAQAVLKLLVSGHTLRMDLKLLVSGHTVLMANMALSPCSALQGLHASRPWNAQQVFFFFGSIAQAVLEYLPRLRLL